MTYEIPAPAPEGPETWMVWIICLSAIAVSIALILLVFWISGGSLDATMITAFLSAILATLFLIIYTGRVSDVRLDYFSENVQRAYEREHSIDIFSSDQISRDGRRQVTFSSEDGMMRYGDVYYDKETDTMVLVERHND